MEPPRRRNSEFGEILDAYAQYINLQVQHYDLPKYGLDPEDILQDVRIRLWKILSGERTIVSPASYIKKIVSSAVIDQLRRRRRENELFRHEKQKYILEQAVPYSGEAIRKKAAEEAVGKAVGRLIDSRRQVVKLYLLNLTLPEISGYLNWSLDKTRNLLYRGLADLKKSLRDLEDENENRSS